MTDKVQPINCGSCRFHRSTRCSNGIENPPAADAEPCENGLAMPGAGKRTKKFKPGDADDFAGQFTIRIAMDPADILEEQEEEAERPLDWEEKEERKARDQAGRLFYDCDSVVSDLPFTERFVAMQHHGFGYTLEEAANQAGVKIVVAGKYIRRVFAELRRRCPDGTE